MIRIHADFNAFDEKGRIVLDYPDDTNRERVDLKDGMHVIVWDASLESEGILEFEDEGWRVRLTPGTRRKTSGELSQQLRDSNAEKDFGTGG